VPAPAHTAPPRVVAPRVHPQPQPQVQPQPQPGERATPQDRRNNDDAPRERGDAPLRGGPYNRMQN
jgi:hypothetical protein